MQRLPSCPTLNLPVPPSTFKQNCLPTHCLTHSVLLQAPSLGRNIRRCFIHIANSELSTQTINGSSGAEILPEWRDDATEGAWALFPMQSMCSSPPLSLFPEHEPTADLPSKYCLYPLSLLDQTLTWFSLFMFQQPDFRLQSTTLTKLLWTYFKGEGRVK